MRIHLEEQLLRVASYPEYDLVLELDDKSKISKEKSYKLFFLSAWLKDVITLVEAYQVNSFDENM